MSQVVTTRNTVLFILPHNNIEESVYTHQSDTLGRFFSVNLNRCHVTVLTAVHWWMPLSYIYCVANFYVSDLFCEYVKKYDNNLSYN